MFVALESGLDLSSYQGAGKTYIHLILSSKDSIAALKSGLDLIPSWIVAKTMTNR